jgi:hypothetical protein
MSVYGLGGSFSVGARGPGQVAGARQRSAAGPTNMAGALCQGGAAGKSAHSGLLHRAAADFCSHRWCRGCGRRAGGGGQRKLVSGCYSTATDLTCSLPSPHPVSHSPYTTCGCKSRRVRVGWVVGQAVGARQRGAAGLTHMAGTLRSGGAAGHRSCVRCCLCQGCCLYRRLCTTCGKQGAAAAAGWH